MTAWQLGTLLFALALVPCAAVTLRGSAFRRLVGLEMAGVVTAMMLLTWAQAEQRPSLLDLGLALAFLSFGAGLVFARFMERWP